MNKNKQKINSSSNSNNNNDSNKIIIKIVIIIMKYTDIHGKHWFEFFFSTGLFHSQILVSSLIFLFCFRSLKE